MARSVDEIYQELLAQKESLPELAGLTSTAKSAIWRLWLYIVAYVMAIHEKLWDEKASELREIGLNALVGTSRWYAQKCREWQNGHQLQLINGKYQYEIDDPDARLVKRVSITEIERGILIKVASEDTDGNPIPLTIEQLANLNAYLNLIKFVGTKIELVSLNADLVQFIITCYYQGSYTNIRDRVILSVTNYLRDLPFDSAITRANIITAINNVEGIEDVYIDQLFHVYGNNNPVMIDRIALPHSGYWQLDGGNNFEIITHEDGVIIVSNGGNCSFNFRLYV